MFRTARSGAGALAVILFAAAPVAAQGLPETDVTVPAVGLTTSSPFISPNGDGRLDRVSLHVTVDEPAVLTVRLSRPGGVGVKLLADQVPVAAGTTTLVWEGRLHRPDGSTVIA